MIAGALFFLASRTRAAIKFSKEFDSESNCLEVWAIGLDSNLFPQSAQKRSDSLDSRPQFEQNTDHNLHRLTIPIISPKRQSALVAPSAGIEPATCGLEVRCSIRLSYEGIEYNSTEARRAEACVGTRVH